MKAFRTTIKLISLCLLLFVLPDCGGRNEIYDEPLRVKGPFALYDRLVYVNETLSEIVTLDLLPEETVNAEVSHIPFEGAVTGAKTSPDLKELFIWDRKGKTFYTLKSGAGEVESEAMNSGFSDFMLSDDGEIVLFYYRHGAPPEEGEIMSNTSEIARIVLTGEPGEGKKWFKAIRSKGRAPDAIRLSPAFTAGGKKSRLAIAEYPSQLFLIDLNDAKEKDVSIPLTPPDSNVSLNPLAGKFHLDGDELSYFLITTNSEDILEIKFPYDPGNEASDENNFAPVINQFASGVSPKAIHIYSGSDGNVRVLSLNAGSKDAVIIDTKAGTKVSVPLGAVYDSIIVCNPGSDGGDKNLALLYSKNYAKQKKFLILDLDAVEEKKGKALETINSESPIMSVGKVREDLFLLGLSGSDNAVALYNYGKKSMTPFSGTGYITDTIIDVPGKRIFFSGRQGYVPYISVLTIGSEDEIGKQVIELDGEADKLFWFPEVNKLAAVYYEVFGDVFLVDARKMEREAGKSFSGFLLDSLLGN